MFFSPLYSKPLSNDNKITTLVFNAAERNNHFRVGGGLSGVTVQTHFEALRSGHARREGESIK